MNFKNTFYCNLASRLIASSLLLVGMTTVVTKAIAAEFIFDGSVADECSFDAASYDGTLTETGTKLVSNTISTTINCNKIGQTLTISDPTADGDNPATADSVTAKAELTEENTATIDTDPDTANGVSAALNNLGDTTIAVSMEADFGTTYPVIPAGDYVYTVTLTLTP